MNIDDYKKWLNDDLDTASQIKRVGEFSEITVPEKYLNIWKTVSMPVQVAKAKTHGLTNEQTNDCLRQLCRRPYYLASIAAEFAAKNIVEVGTAEGLQFYSFAEYAKTVGGHVWSCDLRDVRNTECAIEYNDNTTFLLGDSKQLANIIPEPIDLYYVDASHDYGAVVRDVINLRETQSENPIWIFDDFDKRFGCHKDIERLCQISGKFKIYRVGNAASGNPNHQVIIFGRL